MRGDHRRRRRLQERQVYLLVLLQEPPARRPLPSSGCPEAVGRCHVSSHPPRPPAYPPARPGHLGDSCRDRDGEEGPRTRTGAPRGGDLVREGRAHRGTIPRRQPREDKKGHLGGRRGGACGIRHSSGSKSVPRVEGCRHARRPLPAAAAVAGRSVSSPVQQTVMLHEEVLREITLVADRFGASPSARNRQPGPGSSRDREVAREAEKTERESHVSQSSLAGRSDRTSPSCCGATPWRRSVHHAYPHPMFFWAPSPGARPHSGRPCRSPAPHQGLRRLGDGAWSQG